MAAPAKTRERLKPPPPYEHNRVLAAAYKRLEILEDRMAAVLVPILERAGAKAATSFRQNVTDHLAAAAAREADLEAFARIEPSILASGVYGFRLRPEVLTAAAPTATSTMVCLKPRLEEAEAIADPDGELPEHLHVTLVSIGQYDGPLAPLADAVRGVAATHAPLVGRVGGYGAFDPPGVTILLPDVPGLVELRVAVTEALLASDADYARDHGFEAHISVLDSLPPAEPGDGYPASTSGAPLHFDAILVVRGDDEILEIPLVGVRPLTAAGDPKIIGDARRQVDRAQNELRRALERGDDQEIRAAQAGAKRAKSLLRQAVLGPQWSTPGPDEILDVDNLVQTLRTKTDPIREALLKTTMEPTLAHAGVDFDLTSPHAGRVLAQSGSQIKEIAQTTQVNVMRIVRSAHEEGLSIPDTASAIRDGMKDAAPARARMIARTELAGAVNGGSLAATQIVEEVTGATYVKKWLTAPGAPNPRHELYDGLDGQTQPLDGAFDVGGSELQFPGDPAGDPGETINCRCALVYDTPEGQQGSDTENPPDLSGGSGDLGFVDGGATSGEEGGLASTALVEDVTLGRADGGPEIREALAAINAVHRLPALDAGPIPVKANRALEDTTGAHLVSHREGSVTFPDVIEVNPNSTHIELDFAHEIGHVLDYSLLRSDILPVVDAAKQTDAYQALQSLAGDRAARGEYLLRDREVFARAYSQWIAENSGNQAMLAQVADVVRGAAEHGLSHDLWTPADFAPVRAALDKLFADRGLLKGTPAVAAVPEGITPTSVLAIQGGTRGALVARRAAIEASISDLGNLVTLPDAANLPADGLKVTMRKTQSRRGHLKYQTIGGRQVPLEINVSTESRPALTFAHEFGHLLDLSYLGEEGVPATRNFTAVTGELGDALRALDTAWKESDAYRLLAENGRDRLSQYMLSRSELWARSFAQWSATRGTGALREQLQTALQGEAAARSAGEGSLGWRFYPSVWQADDFDAISTALERVLKAAGLLRPTG